MRVRRTIIRRGLAGLRRNRRSRRGDHAGLVLISRGRLVVSGAIAVARGRGSVSRGGGHLALMLLGLLLLLLLLPCAVLALKHDRALMGSRDGHACDSNSGRSDG